MRIIAGTARSLPLKTIEGMDTRPTTDRIKETLFNMLQNDVPGCYFLDLFAGSGQIGLEAVSRGARYAVFVENNKKACACIEDNIHFTKFDRETKLLQSDVISAIRSMEGKYRFDVIFMDPPYRHEYEKEVLECLKDSSILKEDTPASSISSKNALRFISFNESRCLSLANTRPFESNKSKGKRQNWAHCPRLAERPKQY